MERDDLEAARAVVEHAQPEQVAELQRVVGDRLLRDEHAVGRRAEPREHLSCAAAEEVGVAQGRALRERRGVDAEGVLQVGADVRVGVVDRRHAGHARQRATRREPGSRDAPEARCDDVGAERELRVDARLLVVGRGEDAEVDAEREQQPDDEQAAVDRGAAPAGAREQEAAP